MDSDQPIYVGEIDAATVARIKAEYDALFVGPRSDAEVLGTIDGDGEVVFAAAPRATGDPVVVSAVLTDAAALVILNGDPTRPPPRGVIEAGVGEKPAGK